MNRTKIQAVLIKDDLKAIRWISKSKCEYLLESNLYSWRKSVCRRQGNVGIMEFSNRIHSKEILNRLKLAFELSKTTVKQSVLIAVTDAELSQFRNQLLISGFAGVFCSNSELDKFYRMLEKHAARVCFPYESLEAKILNKIPWKSDTKDHLDDR